ncbi:MAG: hypothetical protein Q8N53_19535 [Longimicrobiales bacterium]|nr:hypothetical protein [Longimicrobiales bacterium]
MMRYLVLPLLLCLSTADATPAGGQVAPKSNAPSPQVTWDNPSSFAFGIGYGSLSSRYLERFIGVEIDEVGAATPADLGGLTFNLRLLLRTLRLDGRLRVGGEFGAVTIKQHERGGGVCIPPGSYCAGPPTDLAYHVNGIAALRLLAGDRFALDAEGGGGVMFFVIPGGGDPMTNSKPGPEVFGSVRLVGSFRISGRATLDPFLAAQRSFGDAHATALNAGLGLSFPWGRRQ